MATWSRYNFVVPKSDGTALLFNARTGELIRLAADRVRECAGKYDLDDEFFNFLLQREFLVPDDLDEVELIAERHETASADGSALSITIELTEACNFRCVYCYQEHAKQHLPEEIEQRILRYLERRLHELKSLHVNWFGGEPLSRLPTLRRLSAGLRSRAEFHGCRLTQFITTNGYLITPAIAAELRTLGISNVQITLDGAREFHDRSRPLASGHGTYERVLAACQHVVNAGIELMVRVNLNRVNADSIDLLLSDLVGHGITPSKAVIHIVRALDHGNLDVSTSSICFKNADFARKWGEILDSVAAHGFGTPTIAPVAYNCPFDLEQAVMIGRDGSLRHCSSTDHEIAKLDSDGQEVDANATYNRVKRRRPTDDPNCRDCRYLPLCMGGCSYLRDRGQEACNPERYVLPQLVELYAMQASPLRQ